MKINLFLKKTICLWVFMVYCVNGNNSYPISVISGNVTLYHNTRELTLSGCSFGSWGFWSILTFSPLRCIVTFPARMVIKLDLWVINKIFGDTATDVNLDDIEEECKSNGFEIIRVRVKRGTSTPQVAGLFGTMRCMLKLLVKGTVISIDYIIGGITGTRRKEVMQDIFTSRAGYFKVTVNGVNRYISPYLFHGMERIKNRLIPAQILNYIFKLKNGEINFRDNPFWAALTNNGVDSTYNNLLNSRFITGTPDERITGVTTSYWTAILGSLFDENAIKSKFSSNFISGLANKRFYMQLVKSKDQTDFLSNELASFASGLTTGTLPSSLVTNSFSIANQENMNIDLATMPFGALSFYFPAINTIIFETVKIITEGGRVTNIYDFDLMDEYRANIVFDTTREYTMSDFLSGNKVQDYTNTFRADLNYDTLPPICKSLIATVMEYVKLAVKNKGWRLEINT